MFEYGEQIDVSMSFDFSNVYDGIFVKYDEGKRKPFLCVSDDTMNDYENGKDFKTTGYPFARPWTHIPDPPEKKIPKSGLSKKAIDYLIGIL